MHFHDMFSMADTFSESEEMFEDYGDSEFDYPGPNLFGARGNQRNQQPNNAPSSAANNVTSEGF